MKAFMYISRAVNPGTASWMPYDFVSLINVSRKNNAKNELTGFLCYQDGHFLQYLEGPTKAMEKLMVSVLRDSRHIDAHVLLNNEITERVFSKWSMPIGNKITKDDEFQNFIRRNQSLFSGQSSKHEEILRNFHVYGEKKPVEDRFRHAIAASTKKHAANTVYDQAV